MKFKGFTLAEVLVTIGIVGVVATMTIPVIAQKYRTSEYTAGIQKAFNTLSTGMETYMVQNNVDLLSKTNFINDPVDELRKVIRVVQGGSYEYSGDYNLVGLNNHSYFIYDVLPGNKQSMTLSDGSFIIFSSPRIDRNESSSSAIAIYLSVDVNGRKKPNQAGRDIFYFYIRNDGRVVPGVRYDGGSYDYSYNNGSNSISGCDDGSLGLNCAQKIMDDGWEMNY